MDLINQKIIGVIQKSKYGYKLKKPDIIIFEGWCVGDLNLNKKTV